MMLQRLYERLAAQYCHDRRALPSGLTMVDSVGAANHCPQEGSGWWTKLTSLVHGAEGDGGINIRRRSAPVGLYMYGGVGCGKTMLMDLLVDAALPEFKVRGRSQL